MEKPEIYTIRADEKHFGLQQAKEMEMKMKDDIVYKMLKECCETMTLRTSDLRDEVDEAQAELEAAQEKLAMLEIKLSTADEAWAQFKDYLLERKEGLKEQDN